MKDMEEYQSSQDLPKQETGDDKNSPENVAAGGLSKNQLKKLKKKENWLKYKAEKRAKEKQHKKNRRKEAREQGISLGPSRKYLKKNTMKDSNCCIQIAIDCGFDDLMSEKDILKLVQQIQFSYSANRRVSDPLQYYVTSLGNKTKQRLDSLGDYKGWDIHFRSESYTDVFGKHNVVYLTSDSPNVLQTLEPEKAYIIGGLVDHNHHKGLCLQLAEDAGIAHAQLPIGDYIELNTRKVLTINHVFEILVQYTVTKDWKDAFFQVIPKRKGLTAKADEENETVIEAEEEETGSESTSSCDSSRGKCPMKNKEADCDTEIKDSSILHEPIDTETSSDSVLKSESKDMKTEVSLENVKS